MTRDDLQIFCTALGFTAVVLKGECAENQAQKAKAFGKLIESFCFTAVPNTVGMTYDNMDEGCSADSIDVMIDCYKAELLNQESACLPSNRDGLLKMYDRLLMRQTRREQWAFYETAHAATIANQILWLVENEIAQHGAVA